MRIFRDHDDHDDDHNHDEEPQRPGHRPGPDEIAAQADLLADEISDFLADNDETADQPAPGRPALRLVPPLPTSAEGDGAAKPGNPAAIPVMGSYARARIWRASAAGSFVVVGLTTMTAWGQPAEVGAPIAVYGLGWIAYLVWNSARRPSPGLALAAFTERRAARVQRELP